jgi:hypothetical protein
MLASIFKLKSRKAQEASTLTWIIATFIILAMVIIFYLFFIIAHNTNGSANLGVLSVKEFTSREGALPLTEKFLILMNLPILVEGRPTSLIKETQSYLNKQIDEEEITCIFRQVFYQKEIFFGRYITGELYINEDKIATIGECSNAALENLYTGGYASPFYPKQETQIFPNIRFMFYDCNVDVYERARLDSCKKKIHVSISSFSLENPSFNKPEQRTLTVEEKAKLDQILSDKIDIIFGGVELKFNNGVWKGSIAGGETEFSEYNIRETVLVKSSKYYYNLLSASKENNRWFLPIKYTE